MASFSAGPSPDPRVSEAAAAVSALIPQQISPSVPRVGVVLGSGLGGFADSIAERVDIPYSSIPHLRAPTVAGHGGNLSFGRLSIANVVCLRGRIHLYEGHPVEDVVYGCRLLGALGCGAVLLTNAAGGIRDGFAPGSLMVLTDHLNLTGSNPLVGAGYSFVDLTRAYDRPLRDAALRAARESSITLHEGVYAGMLGPSYETPAEIRMLRALGADAVGMSTVMETIALRQLGVRVGAMSCITNLAAGLSGEILTHREVEETARRSRGAFETLVARWVVLAAEALLSEP